MHTLRPYQEQDSVNILTTLDSVDRVLYRLDTGGGKTVILAHLCKTWVDTGHSILILAHRTRLLTQIQGYLESLGISTTIAMGTTIPMKSNPVILCTPNSAVVPSRLESLKVSKRTIIIIDEAHRSTSVSYTTILTNLMTPGMKLLGVTATPSRLDGVPLDSVYDTMVNSVVGIPDLIQAGYLLPLKYYSSIVIDYSRIKKNKNGEYTISGLSTMMNTPSVTTTIISNYLKYGAGKPCIVFAVSIDHATSLQMEFQTKGISSAIISGTTSDSDRTALLEQFGITITVLITVEVLTEGVDLPQCNVVLLARPTASVGLYLQMVGRVVRPDGHSTHGVVLDCVGMIHLHGHPSIARQWTIQGDINDTSLPPIPKICKDTTAQMETFECEELELLPPVEYFQESIDTITALSSSITKLEFSAIKTILDRILSDSGLGEEGWKITEHLLTKKEGVIHNPLLNKSIKIGIVGWGILPMIQYEAVNQYENNIEQGVNILQHTTILGIISKTILDNKIDYAKILSMESTSDDMLQALNDKKMELEHTTRVELEAWINSMIPKGEVKIIVTHEKYLPVHEYFGTHTIPKDTTKCEITIHSLTKLLKYNPVTVACPGEYAWYSDKVPTTTILEFLLRCNGIITWECNSR